MKLRRSKFVVLTPSDSDLNKIHLYHTLYDHHVAVEQTPENTITSLIQRVESGDALSEDEQSVVNALLQMRILVDVSANEFEEFKNWYENVLCKQNETLVAHITTTMACNMRCRYCMERDRLDQSQFMEHETALSTVLWLKRKIKDGNIKKLSLIFFGGEPLLNVSAIKDISSDLSEFCKYEGLAFKAGAITNTTLLTREMSEILANSGVSWIKTTIDGERQHHDKLRTFINGSGTFDVIWQNLSSASERLRIFIGCNFCDANEDSCRALIKTLASVPWRKSICDVRFKPIMAPDKNMMSGSCDRGAFTPEQVDRMLELRGEVKKAGLPIIDDPNMGPCDFYRSNVITIGIRGELYPCSGFVGISDLVMGSVTHDEPTEVGKFLSKVKSWSRECSGCSYLPLCAGGCRLPAYLAGRGIEHTVCDRDFYEKVLPHLVAGYDEATSRSGIFA